MWFSISFLENIVNFYFILTWCDHKGFWGSKPKKMNKRKALWWKAKVWNPSLMEQYHQPLKAKHNKALPIDGDGKGRCGLLWLFFSLFVFLQVMSNASFIVQWRSLCSRFFIQGCLVMLLVLHYYFVGLQSRRISRQKKWLTKNLVM